MYKALNKQAHKSGNYTITPLRYEDRLDIMRWRNEQIYHLRQNQPLTEVDQNNYFKDVVKAQFSQKRPNNILFSFLKNDVCIGYGGLVHINWTDKNAEISFIMDTSFEENYFQDYWTSFLGLIEKVAFLDLKLHKIFTYAYDIRPNLFKVLLQASYLEEARLIEHCFFEDKFIDVLIHSKINSFLTLRKATDDDTDITFDWATNKRIRQYSRQKEDIIYKNHELWFFNKIMSTSCIYLIAEINKTPIGSIRFDIEKDEAVLSFLLDPSLHGKGYGKKILEKGCKEFFRISKVKKILGVVSIKNLPSIRTFKKLEFTKVLEKNEFITFEKIKQV
ncbi:GNAT family N-acetyltransferase [Flavobacteriaceae bacterium]|nr:GNAT family N-acetyltransferase [Flavobacteriaceae bacterium]